MFGVLFTQGEYSGTGSFPAESEADADERTLKTPKAIADSRLTAHSKKETGFLGTLYRADLS